MRSPLRVTPIVFCFRCFVPPPSQGLIVLCALNQHVAVRIYRPASNQSAPFRASLRRARPISAAERDPCLWVVLRCGHVTLGKGMPTWIRGKDATWVRYNNTTRGGRKRENRNRHRRRRFLHRPTFALNTVGRGRFSGSPRSDQQRDGGECGTFFFFFDPAELESRGFLCRRSCRQAACRVFCGSFVANAVLASFSLVCWAVLRAHTAVGASARAMFTSPVGVESEALLQHVLRSDSSYRFRLQARNRQFISFQIRALTLVNHSLPPLIPNWAYLNTFKNTNALVLVSIMQCA